MPNTDHSIAFWESAAIYFRNDKNVIFDIFNEPYPDRAPGANNPWGCLKDGGWCAGIGYQVAGMQSLVDAIRNKGVNNVIMVSGLAYSNDLSKWLDYVPSDPQN